MFNFFDLDVIPTLLGRFKVKRVLIIGLSNKTIMEELFPFFIENKCLLYAIDSKIDINNLMSEYDGSENYLKDNVNYIPDDSLNVLRELNNFDAVFINGDPNWYTVYNELNIIKKNNSKFPIVFVCNNKYPHKRRDSYRDPNIIPNEFKNECCNDLPILYKEGNEIKCTNVKDGFCHAIDENTPKNGVLTAIEDFLKENSSLKFLELNQLEGISLIYLSSEFADNIIDEILKKQVEIDYTVDDLSDKILENDILLKNVSRLNILKDDIDKVEEFKHEINEKDNQLKDYEDKINIQNSQIIYKDSKLKNIESQINLEETKIQSVQSKLLNKDYEIKFKEEELEFVNSQLLTKENELTKTKNRLLNLEGNFLRIKDDLNLKISSQADELEHVNSQLLTKEKELKETKDKLIKSEYDFSEINKELVEVKNQSNKYNNDLICKDVENKYLKNDNKLSKKLISPLAYIYLAGKSNPNEIVTNIKLYRTLKRNNCFDIGYYLTKYPDISKSDWCKYFSPQLHYVCIGFDENRKFNENEYNNKNRKELLKDIENI